MNVSYVPTSYTETYLEIIQQYMISKTAVSVAL
jgi:hypothetical protein